MALSFSNDNAAASANAGEALRGLGNFLYEQQVQKPNTQAQTAQTQAQTQALQQQMTGAQMQQNAAKLQILRESLFSPDQEQATNISTQGNAPQSSTTSSVTGPVGDGSSGPPPASSMQPQEPNSPAGGAVNMAGSSRQGPDTISTPDWTKPKTSLAPISNDDLSSVALTKPSTPAGTPGQPGATATPPSTGMSNTPSITSPVSPTASVKQPDILAPALGQTYDQLTPEQQSEVLRRGHSKLANAGFGGFISDAGMVKEWNEQQQSTVPLARRPVGAVVTTGEVPLAGGGAGKIVNGGALSAITKGSNGGSPWLINPVTGEASIDPRFAAAASSTAPKEVAATTDDLNNINQVFKQIKDVREAVAAYPSIIGNVTGGKVGDAARWLDSAAANIASAIGVKVPGVSSAPQAASDMVKRFMSKQFLESLTTLHVGRVTDQEVKKINDGLPQAMRSPEAFNDYIDKTLIPMLSDHQKTVMDEFEKQTGQPAPAPKFNLGGLPASVSAPGVSAPVGAPSAGAQAPAKSSLPVMRTPEEAKQKLAPGAWFQTPQGVPRQLH